MNTLFSQKGPSKLSKGTPVSRSRSVVLFSLIAVAGCSTLGPLAPVPPIVEDLSDGAEYQWAPFKWTPGKKLVYRTEVVTETLVGSRTSTTRTETSATMRGVDRTAGGLVRVAMATDNKDLGFLLVDEHGRLQDIAHSGPALHTMAAENALKSFLGLAQSLSEQFEAHKFTLKHPHTVDLTYLLGIFLPRQLAELGKETEFSFLGYKRLAGRRVAALRADLAHVLKAPVPLPLPDRPNEFIDVDNVALQGLQYYEADQGYSVTDYMVWTMGGTSRGQRIVVRATTLKVLEREKSAGI